jgi:3-oxoacyl-[acyl-carrier protein] reductase
VTGGSRGIGRAIAARFVADGDTVVITGRDVEALSGVAEEIGARAQRCDVAVPADVAALREAVGERAHVLVNMAGGNLDSSDPLPDDAGLEQIAQRWRDNVEVNLIGTVLVTTALAPAIGEGGAVVNVSSIGAEYAANSYSAAKAAVAAWTAGVSAQLGPRGVTANTIAPGYIADTDFFNGTLTDERRSTLIAATHDKRAGHPGDVAETAFFLASPAARHITGQTIHVNGGAYTTR